ncbi:arylsulfatase A-like enzyme [Roseimicrobium gellanilyticum]|uniref:Arylsulfatase A-like enzyme n=1 Tax=Roseimicrobium gellanilyticum TaxID=748857 RepID=A0A366HNR6_9BACT|nr:sulfatase-like hydrolase/transferase [Roseimicrobium gellanilyticum]RBP44426.1 arylsulfatase A-like enzyme [Roseimicrobium gellanilyticum]
MKLPTFLASLLLALGFHLSATAADQRPNVIVIVSDDQGWADVGYHNPEMRTPNLDRLAKEGVELDHHYVQPQCTPTRVALMTARYPSRFGPHCTQASADHAYPFETLTMGKMFQSLGYDTALIGKWHMGSKQEWGPNHHGFHYSYGCFDGAVGPLNHLYRKNAKSWHRNGEFIEEEGHATDLIAREASQWISRKHDGNPFFLYLAFTAVHTPVVEEQKWLDANAHISDPDRRLFAASATHMDSAIGEVVATLEKQKLRENTLIIFTSDNGGIHKAYKGSNYPEPDPSLAAGFSSNAPLRGGKGEMYEGGMRVPAFINWPAKLKPHKLSTPMHVVDWMPTLAALTGYKPAADADPKWDGQNIFALLEDPAASSGPREFYWVWGAGRFWEGQRHGDWKIIRENRKPKGKAAQEAAAAGAPPASTWMLFNVAEDPLEKTDLAAAKTEIVADLVSRFEAQKQKDNLKPGSDGAKPSGGE